MLKSLQSVDERKIIRLHCLQTNQGMRLSKLLLHYLCVHQTEVVSV